MRSIYDCKRDLTIRTNPEDLPLQSDLEANRAAPYAYELRKGIDPSDNRCMVNSGEYAVMTLT